MPTGNVTATVPTLSTHSKSGELSSSVLVVGASHKHGSGGGLGGGGDGGGDGGGGLGGGDGLGRCGGGDGFGGAGSSCGSGSSVASYPGSCGGAGMVGGAGGAEGSKAHAVLSRAPSDVTGALPPATHGWIDDSVLSA